MRKPRSQLPAGLKLLSSVFLWKHAFKSMELYCLQISPVVIIIQNPKQFIGSDSFGRGEQKKVLSSMPVSWPCEYSSSGHNMRLSTSGVANNKPCQHYQH